MTLRTSNSERDVVQNRWTIFILAGGMSRRMGRDKSRIRLNGVSLLNLVKQAAISTGHPAKTIRTDIIENCGPLSGIYTGLLRARTPWRLFLSCDMPLLNGATLKEIIAQTERESRPVFTETEHGFGFPLSISTDQTEQIKALIDEGKRSIFQAARALDPSAYKISGARKTELLNVNTPEELQQLLDTINARAT
jgi:molybdopterin-guanine dinucleotide biosynthesis protein A